MSLLCQVLTPAVFQTKEWNKEERIKKQNKINMRKREKERLWQKKSMPRLWASSIQILHNLSGQLKCVNKLYFYLVRTLYVLGFEISVESYWDFFSISTGHDKKSETIKIIWNNNVFWTIFCLNFVKTNPKLCLIRKV